MSTPQGMHYRALGAPDNSMGTASLILGLIGFFFFGFIFGTLAIVFGAIGLSKVKHGQATNKGSAMAGLILGVIGVIIWSLLGYWWWVR
jgi:hypothetical protein